MQKGYMFIQSCISIPLSPMQTVELDLCGRVSGIVQHKQLTQLLTGKVPRKKLVKYLVNTLLGWST